MDKIYSNKDVDWTKHYDYYEIELRSIYRTMLKPQNDSHFEMLKSMAKKYLKKDKVFCEIGFGAGITLRKAMNYFGKIYGLDISPKNVEFTEKELKQEGYENFELYVSDIMEFDKRFEKKFDVISFIHGLEHFSNEDYPVVLNNIKKYLKHNGIFTGALPNKSGFNYRMCPRCNYIFEIDGHLSNHDLHSLRKVFLNNGFEIIHLDNFNFKYQLSYGGILKKIYRLIFYGILKQKRNSQIEFIVMNPND